MSGEDAGVDSSGSGNTNATPVVVDRTLHPLLTTQSQPPTTTPSSVDSISPQIERLHRLHGASLIQSAAALLKLSPSATATACSMFHRLYHRISLGQLDVWSAAMGCVMLAGKVEECPRRIREVMTVFVHLYRRRRLSVGWDKNDDDKTDDMGKKKRRLTTDEKLNLLRYQHPLPPNSQLYKDWFDALASAETEILRQLGFTLYWIPDHHPHKFILYFVRVLGLDQNCGGGGEEKNNSDDKSGIGESSISVAQRSWNYCNDASLLDLSVRYEPEIVACAAILLATQQQQQQQQQQHQLSMTPQPWWEVFVGPGRGDDLIAICNAILALNDGDVDGDWRTEAMRGFVPSLVKGGSFNDPGSFSWDALEDSVA